MKIRLNVFYEIKYTTRYVENFAFMAGGGAQVFFLFFGEKEYVKSKFFFVFFVFCFFLWSHIISILYVY